MHGVADDDDDLAPVDAQPVDGGLVLGCEDVHHVEDARGRPRIDELVEGARGRGAGAERERDGERETGRQAEAHAARYRPGPAPENGRSLRRVVVRVPALAFALIVALAASPTPWGDDLLADRGRGLRADRVVEAIGADDDDPDGPGEVPRFAAFATQVEALLARHAIDTGPRPRVVAGDRAVHTGGGLFDLGPPAPLAVVASPFERRVAALIVESVYGGCVGGRWRVHVLGADLDALRASATGAP